MSVIYTSFGFHTFTIFSRLTIVERNAILRGFKEYAEETGKIRVRPMRNNSGDIIHNFHIIEYINDSKGITWSITFNSMLGDRPYSIKAKINPKILIGTKDFITAARYRYLGKVEDKFNEEAEKISIYLGRFRQYSLHRIDYCINFDVKELRLGCTPQQLMKLIKQADIPLHFSERTAYDEKSHRTKADRYSFYLECDSAVINCYWKHWQLSREYPECEDLENSFNVIRFEIQCKYSKVYAMSKLILDDNREFPNEMLSDFMSAVIIRRYLDKVIGNGNYHTLDFARKMIGLKRFQPQKERRLIGALNFIRECRGIANAKAALQEDDSEDFRRSLRELSGLGINPITIPKEWRITSIPNLIDAYNRKIDEERVKEEMIDDYLKKRRKKKSKKKKIKKSVRSLRDGTPVFYSDSLSNFT